MSTDMRPGGVDLSLPAVTADFFRLTGGTLVDATTGFLFTLVVIRWIQNQFDLAVIEYFARSITWDLFAFYFVVAVIMWAAVIATIAKPAGWLSTDETGGENGFESERQEAVQKQMVRVAASVYEGVVMGTAALGATLVMTTEYWPYAWGIAIGVPIIELYAIKHDIRTPLFYLMFVPLGLSIPYIWVGGYIGYRLRKRGHAAKRTFTESIETFKELLRTATPTSGFYSEFALRRSRS